MIASIAQARARKMKLEVEIEQLTSMIAISDRCLAVAAITDPAEQRAAFRALSENEQRLACHECPALARSLAINADTEELREFAIRHAPASTRDAIELGLSVLPERLRCFVPSAKDQITYKTDEVFVGYDKKQPKFERRIVLDDKGEPVVASCKRVNDVLDARTVPVAEPRSSAATLLKDEQLLRLDATKNSWFVVIPTIADGRTVLARDVVDAITRLVPDAFVNVRFEALTAKENERYEATTVAWDAGRKPRRVRKPIAKPDAKQETKPAVELAAKPGKKAKP
jgi:hypothetical protein